MDPRYTKQDLDFLLSNTHSREVREIQAIHLAASHARDQALGKLLGRGFRALRTSVVALFETLATWPERRRTYEDLRSLTDRELADIGLTRGEIARVFEPGFAFKARRPAANDDRGPAPAMAARARAA